ncbi:DUF2147 domain-containing protein [uncultured Psychrobacter sp.]|nr:DUF2147 domain-containing protein [uncultured Psychrobacter sp.]
MLLDSSNLVSDKLGTVQSLDLRGYVGTPLFGRSQTWQRIK